LSAATLAYKVNDEGCLALAPAKHSKANCTQYGASEWVDTSVGAQYERIMRSLTPIWRAAPRWDNPACSISVRMYAGSGLCLLASGSI